MSGVSVIGTLQPSGLGGYPTHTDSNGLGGFQSAADVTARDAIPALNRKTGMLVWTIADTSMWQLAPNLTTWVEVPWVGSVALTQASWFIDPAGSHGGSDSNVGTDSGHPLLTFGELSRRFGPTPWAIKQATVITWMSSSGDTVDPVDVNMELSGPYFIYFQGTPTAVSSGTFSAVVAKDRATQTRPTVKDGSRAWTLGDRIRITTAGPRFGAIAWVQKDLGAGIARTTDWQIRTEDVVYQLAIQVNPQVGDAYVVESLPSINLGVYDCHVSTINGGTPYVFFRDLQFQNSPFLAALRSAGVQTTVDFVHCRFVHEELFCFTNSQFLNCHVEGHLDLDTVVSTAFLSLSGGGASGALGAGVVHANARSIISLDFDWISDNYSFAIDSGAYGYIGSAGLFDTLVSEDTSNGDAVLVGDISGQAISGPSNLELQQNQDASPLLWGNGNTGHGIALGVNSSVNIGAGVPTPTITGLLGDWRFGSQVTELTGIAYDATTFAPGAPLACTWVNLDLPQPAGFGGAAHHPPKNNHILNRGTASSGNTATNQTDWYISFATGSDNNTGITSGSKLKTFAELFRRWGSRNPIFTIPLITIHVTDHDVSDAISGAFNCLGPTTIISIQSTSATLVHSGTLTAVTTKDIPSNVPPKVKDGTVTWTPGTRIRLTSGTHAGALAWINKDEGAGVARTTDFMLTDVDPSVTLTPTSGDAYTVESLTILYIADIYAYGVGLAAQGSVDTTPGIQIRDMNIQGGPAGTIGINGNLGITLVNSMFDGAGFTTDVAEIAFGSLLTCYNAYTKALEITLDSARMTSYGGGALGLGHSCGVWVENSSAVRVSDFIGQNYIFTVGGGSNCVAASPLGSFDAVGGTLNPNGDGLLIGMVHNGADSFGGTFSTAYTGTVWGSGNNGVGVAVLAGSTFLFYGAIPCTITGTGGDVSVGRHASGVSYLTDGSQSTPFLASWANIAKFGSVHNPGDNSHVLSFGSNPAVPATQQATWFIDPAGGSSGNDSNSGVDAGHPLLTTGEMLRRLGSSPFSFKQDTTIQYMSSYPDTTADPLNLFLFVDGPWTTTILGTATTTSSGTFTTPIVAKNRASQQRPRVKDGTRTWTIGDRIRITQAGPNFGATAWVQKDIGGGVAETTDFMIWDIPFDQSATRVDPTLGDSYVVESLSAVNLGILDVKTSAINVGLPSIAFRDVWFNAPPLATFLTGSIGFFTSFLQCRFTDNTIAASGLNGIFFANCHFDGDVEMEVTGGVNLYGGGGHGAHGGAGGLIHCLQGGQASFDWDFFMVNFNMSIEYGSTANISTAASFDTTAGTNNLTGCGLQLGSNTHFSGGNGNLVLQAYADPTGPALWGNGHLGAGIEFGANSTLDLGVNIGGVTVCPSITGAGGDWQFGPLASDNVGIYYDPISLAQSEPKACTWANLVAAQPAGFNFSAHNPLKNNHIVARKAINGTETLSTIPWCTFKTTTLATTANQVLATIPIIANTGSNKLNIVISATRTGTSDVYTAEYSVSYYDIGAGPVLNGADGPASDVRKGALADAAFNTLVVGSTVQFRATPWNAGSTRWSVAVRNLVSG